jgi:hypothetical protein
VNVGGPGGPALLGLTGGVFARLARDRLPKGSGRESPEVAVEPVRSTKTIRVRRITPDAAD